MSNFVSTRWLARCRPYRPCFFLSWMPLRLLFVHYPICSSPPLLRLPVRLGKCWTPVAPSCSDCWSPPGGSGQEPGEPFTLHVSQALANQGPSGLRWPSYPRYSGSLSGSARVGRPYPHPLATAGHPLESQALGGSGREPVEPFTLHVSQALADQGIVTQASAGLHIPAPQAPCPARLELDAHSPIL